MPLFLTAVALGLTLWLGGLAAFITVAILGILEVSFSFDNAIVNAKILQRMSPKWQRLFLTVGVLIAVFGMRLVFPLVIVALSAHINPVAALHLAITDPSGYAHHIAHAHPAIAAFGGVFLLMLFLDWLFEEREIRWLVPLERQLYAAGRITNMSVILTTAILIGAATFLGHSAMVLTSGILGLLVYLLVSSLDSAFEGTTTNIAKTGLGTFLYLEVLDASFSFDGVVGAFAVTNNIFYIAVGLGIGALFVRSLTVFLVHKGTLAEYRYLEHGAHWAIGSLAILLLLTIRWDIPDVVTGLIGVTFIGLAYINSIKENHHGIIRKSQGTK